jgi:hypothetical protein
MKLKALIEIDRSVWGEVKNYATVNSLPLNRAVGLLIKQSLIDNGYLPREGNRDE